MNEIYVTDNHIAISDEVHKEWKKKLNQYSRFYLYAMSGFGKSENAKAFAEKHFSKWVRISAGEEEFLKKTEDYVISHKNAKVRTLLILEDLQWLLDKEEQGKLSELLRSFNKYDGKLQCMLISRVPLPGYLKPLYLTRQLTAENKEALYLREEQVEQLLRKEELTEYGDEKALKAMIACCKVVTKSYPLAVCSFIRQLKAGRRDFENIGTLVKEDIFEYYDRTLFVKWPKNHKEAITQLAVYPKFTMDMAKYILGEEAHNIINHIMDISSILSFIIPDTYEIENYFLEYLISRQQVLLSDEKRNWLYNKAGKCYEEMREFSHALRCYKEAGNHQKVIELTMYLNENTDGCDFAKISEAYLQDLPEEMEDRFPQVLGAKTLLFAYQMKIGDSTRYLDQLKKRVNNEKNFEREGEALKTYRRTLLALPYQSAEEATEQLGFVLNGKSETDGYHSPIIFTGNMPSVINGKLDFLFYPDIKTAVEDLDREETAGIADVCRGESLYEENKKTKAISYLSKGLFEASAKEIIQVQYAAEGVMARLLQSEGRADTAETRLMSMLNKAKAMGCMEVIPNIRASLIYCALLKGEACKIAKWLEDEGAKENQKFYITDRFRLMTKARVYVGLGRSVEALYILAVLEEYARIYNRSYFQIEINLLKAIIFYRQGDEWKSLFLETVHKAYSYDYIHILSDQGTALLPLWKEMEWEKLELKSAYIHAVYSELKKMAAYYPNYLKEIQETEALSKKESEVIRLMAQGYTNAKIAEELQVSMATVKFHIANLLKKLGAQNRTMAVRAAQEKKIL